MDEVGFEHLHLHTTQGSLLDGWGFTHEYAERASKINQKFLCVTDHGSMAAIPGQIKSCEKYNISPLFGVELYVNPLQIAGNKEEISKFKEGLSEIDKKIFNKSFHLLAIAYNKIGYSNLVKLNNWAWTKGFYRRPRVNHEILNSHKDGIIFSSCCYMSEIGQAFDGFCCEAGDESAFKVLDKYIAMFGDNFRLELMMLDFKKQKPYDEFIIKAHEKYGIPVILTQDCHYSASTDSKYQRYMLMVQTKRTISDIQKAMESGDVQDYFELQDQNLWMKSEHELNEKWKNDYSDIIDYDIFKSAKMNTVEICEKAKGVEIDRSSKLPQFPDAEEKLKEYVIEGFKYRELPRTKEYLNRIKEEFDLVCRKGYASYFLIKKSMTDEARRVCPELLGYGDGWEAVGWGRGSAPGFLLCYCLGITNIDPIRHGLLAARFLSEDRGGRTMRLDF